MAFDAAMEARHGSGYNAEEVVRFAPQEEEPLRFPEGEVLPIQEAPPVIIPHDAPRETKSLCEITEEEEDECRP